MTENRWSDRDVLMIMIVCSLVFFVVGAIVATNYVRLNPEVTQPINIPTFLNRTPDNRYILTYVDAGCVAVISLSQGDGGIWYRDGNGGCFASPDNAQISTSIPPSCGIKEIGLGGSIYDKVFLYTCGDSNWLAIVHENGTVTWSKAP